MGEAPLQREFQRLADLVVEALPVGWSEARVAVTYMGASDAFRLQLFYRDSPTARERSATGYSALPFGPIVTQLGMQFEAAGKPRPQSIEMRLDSSGTFKVVFDY